MRGATYAVALWLGAFALGCGPTDKGAGNGGGPDGGDPGQPDANLNQPDARPTIDAPPCQSAQVTAEEATYPVDIIFAVDTSGSMDFESSTVETNLDDFAMNIGGWGLDYRVIMVAKRGGGDDVCVSEPLAGPGCADNTRFRHVDMNVSSDEALQKLVEAYPSYQDFLRPNSIKSFVVVSDDEADSSYDDDWFRGQLSSMTSPGFPSHPVAPEGYIFHSIVAWGDLPFIGCITGAQIGNSYLNLTALTSGVKAKVCETDWNPIFAALETAVVSNTTLPCTFDVPDPPIGETLDPDRVNVSYTPNGGSPTTIPRVDSSAACGGSQGWYYDNPSDPMQIIMCPATCSDFENNGNGDSVDIQFGCATIVD